ncbi:MAG: RNA polymerase sigma factor [Phycisphaerae bacterium]|nr:RNA polymerase sigma factor [Phycisphaerae bacterium]
MPVLAGWAKNSGKNVKFKEQQAGFAHHIDWQQGLGSTMEYSEQMSNSLAARLRAGNRAAAAELVDIYYRQIYIFMRRLGHDSQTSEDLTQDSFIHAWQHISQLKSGKTLNGWMYQIAANVSRLYWRRHKGGGAVNIDGMDLPAGGESGNDKTANSEQVSRLKKAVAELPVKLKQAVVLHYLQHLTIAEAAEAVGVRNGTFKSRLNRALETLRSQVDF